MKKSFLKTSIVLGLFAIFLLGQVSVAVAQERKVVDPEGTKGDFVNQDGVKQEKITYTFDDGSYAESYRKFNSLDKWQSDYYRKDRQKMSYTQKKTAKPNSYLNKFAAIPADAPTVKQQVDAAKTKEEGKGENFVTNGLQALVLQLLISASQFVSWLVSFTGYVFDTTLKQTTEFPDWAQIGVENSWKIVRDITNMILVFSLLYLGIKTIIEGQGFADKKTLISIIIAAVLINFSLVFVKDIAFTISNSVGNEILTASGSTKKAGSSALSPQKDGSTSAQLMNLVKPAQALGKYKSWPARNVAEQDDIGWQSIFKMVGQFIMLTAVTMSLAVIFIGASIILLHRFVIFIVLMIFSPFGLVSLQIPWLKKYGDDWFDQLKKQTLFFPTFVLVLYMVLLIVSNLAQSGSLDLSNDVGDTLLGYLFNFVLIIAFMLLILILPGKIGASGASMMTGAADWTTKKIKAMPRRTAGYASGGVARSGRYLIGNKFANKIGGNTKEKREALQEKARSGNFLQRTTARAKLNASESLKGKTFDIRNSETIKKSEFGKGMGKGIENYTEAVKTKTKEIKDKRDKEMKAYGYDELHKTPENRTAIVNAEKVRKDEEETLTEHKDHLKFMKESGTGTAADIQDLMDRIIAQEKILEASEKEVGRLKNIGEDEWNKQSGSKKIRKFFGTTSGDAALKSQQETEKQWKEKGQSSARRKERSEELKLERSLAPRNTGSPTRPTPPATS